MLILGRKRNESIIIGPNGEIKLIVLNAMDGCVKLGIEAPLEIPVHREEIYLKIKKDKLRTKKTMNELE